MNLGASTTEEQPRASSGSCRDLVGSCCIAESRANTSPLNAHHGSREKERKKNESDMKWGTGRRHTNGPRMNRRDKKERKEAGRAWCLLQVLAGPGARICRGSTRQKDPFPNRKEGAIRAQEAPGFPSSPVGRIGFLTARPKGPSRCAERGSRLTGCSPA